MAALRSVCHLGYLRNFLVLYGGTVHRLAHYLSSGAARILLQTAPFAPDVLCLRLRDRGSRHAGILPHDQPPGRAALVATFRYCRINVGSHILGSWCLAQPRSTNQLRRSLILVSAKPTVTTDGLGSIVRVRQGRRVTGRDRLKSRRRCSHFGRHLAVIQVTRSEFATVCAA
jgi:hypothetical protein